MTRERDSLGQLCRRAREHEEPSAADRAFVREQLAARLAAASIAAAAAATAGKSAASTAPLAASGPAALSEAAALKASATALKAGTALKIASLAGTGAWLAAGASVTAAVLLVHSLSGTPDHSRPVAPQPSARVIPERMQPVAPKVTRSEPAPPPAPSAIEPVRATNPERPPAPAFLAASVKPRLADEARELARVQRALRDGDSSAALALLDEQDRRFRGGSLGAERTAARALAGCAAGRGGARDQAARFVARNAGSPLAERVQRKCLGPR